jgi:hypothetical protein
LSKGFRAYYNYVRLHMALDDHAPALAAGLELDLGVNDWEGLIKMATITEYHGRGRNGRF